MKCNECNKEMRYVGVSGEEPVRGMPFNVNLYQCDKCKRVEIK